MEQQIVYVSVDVEASGSRPGRHSMLSIGADARLTDGTKLGLFSVNLAPLPDGEFCPDTMENFWQKHPQAWQATQIDQKDPLEGMLLFAHWLENLQKTLHAQTVFVAYPLAFDYDYVMYYSRRFLDRDLFNKGIDMRSMTMGILGVDFDKTSKAHMPAEWQAMEEMTHIAVEDAIQQADLFFRMLAASRKI